MLTMIIIVIVIAIILVIIIVIIMMIIIAIIIMIIIVIITTIITIITKQLCLSSAALGSKAPRGEPHRRQRGKVNGSGASQTFGYLLGGLVHIFCVGVQGDIEFDNYLFCPRS